jgi:prevent-host-death family protein
MAKRLRVGIHEAKTHLSQILRDVEGGAEVIVERGGRPIAKIVRATDQASPADSYGLFAGQFVVGDDFDADSEHLADLFGIPR